MKSKLLAAFLAFGLLLPCLARAEETTGPSTELKALFARTAAKVKEGKRTAAELAEEIAAFDALRAKYKDQKTEEVAQIAFMQAMLYSQVLEDSEKARELLLRIKSDFPGSELAAAADEAIAAADHRARAEKIATELVGKAAPELHFEWANRDGLKTLGELKGKVVVLEFWATWCGPCVQAFPQVRELTEHYHGSAVEVVGVTSIQGAIIGLKPAPIDTKGVPEKEMALMKDYIKAKNITWTIAFSAEDVFNPEYGIIGIPHMTIIAPDGTVRYSGMRPGTPHTEQVEKIDAILKEFGKPVPATPAKS